MERFSYPKDFALPHLLSHRDATAPILVAFSGGADSSLLLYLLCRYHLEFGTEIYVAHVNHKIRGAEAEGDEAFCRECSEKYGLRFFCRSFDVPRIARETGESIELCARKLRYGFFAELMREHGIELLATAHNATDNAETVIFNMARGSGADGICGIPTVRPFENGLLIRPIYRMTKKEVLACCEKYGLRYVTDSTNTDTSYTRNNIRANIIPRLSEINSAAEKNILRMCRSLREDAEYLEGIAGKVLGQWDVDFSSLPVRMDADLPAGLEKPVFYRVTRMMLGRCGCASPEEVHISSIRLLLDRMLDGSAVSLPNGICARIDGQSLVIDRDKTKKDKISSLPPRLNIRLSKGYNNINVTNGKFVLCDGSDVHENVECESHEKSITDANVYKIATSTYLNFDSIKGVLYLRNRIDGDTLKMRGMTRRLKKLLCDAGIPRSMRDEIPLLCDDEGILWVPFIGLCDRAKPGADSRTLFATYSHYSCR